MKLLLTISALLFAMGSFAQNADDLADKETTIQFSKKVKFPDILLAGQPRSNSRYCNGESCPIPLSNTVLDGNNKVLMPAARQHLKYRKAKISKIGFCYVEIFVDRDLLKNYLVETNGAKETAKLIARVQTNLGEPTRKEPHKIVWIQEGEYQVTSILEIYDKNSKAKFTSYAD